MKSCHENCKAVKIERRRVIGDDKGLPKADIIRKIEIVETYRKFGFQQTRLIRQNRLKQVREENIQQIKLLTKPELNSGNLIKFCLSCHTLPGCSNALQENPTIIQRLQLLY